MEQNTAEHVWTCVYVSLEKEELKEDHATYLSENPEIRSIISDFLHFLLLRKPDDVFQFAREYFLHFASGTQPELYAGESLMDFNLM